MNIKECVPASFWYSQSALSLAFAHPCGNQFLSSWQLVWGTWKSQRQDLNGKKLLDPPCQGILMVTLPQCHYSEDQALSCLYCQKPCLKITPSQGIWYPQPRSESNGFQVFLLPCFSLSGQIMGQVLMSVWMWTVTLRFDTSAVSMSMYVCVPSQAKQESAELSSCWPLTAADPLSYPPIIVFCYLACRDGRHCENQSRLFPRRAWLNV